MSYLESIGKVLVVGLILGAGLPAIFAVGLVAYSNGAGSNSSGSNGEAEAVRAANPALRSLGLALFALVGAVILMALLWITRTTIEHHFGVNLFPFAQ